MSEENTQHVEEQQDTQELVEEAVAEVNEEIEQQDQQEETQEAAQRRSDKEENMRRLREKTERLERERDEALRIAQQLYSNATKNKASAQEDDDGNDDLKIDPDDIVEGKHFSRFQNRVKKIESELRTYQKQATEFAIESRLKANYKDFDEVVNSKNVEMLRELEPDVAEAISDTRDLYKKAVLAYKMIKKLGIQGDDKYENDRQRAQTNAKKPRPTTSISAQQGDSPLTKANAFSQGLTDELRQQLLREMNEARKGQ